MVDKFYPFVAVNKGVFARFLHLEIFFVGIVVPDVISDENVNVHAEKSLTAPDIIVTASVVVGRTARDERIGACTAVHSAGKRLSVNRRLKCK
jgi:hypothetical protein